jgi:two-component system, NarL family, sensor histidine kinase UhpB
MPLRMRLIALVAAVLLVSLACGSILVGWHAASSVQTELRAALDVGTNTIRNGFDDLAGADDRARELRRLVATFDGNRHVRATLLDAQGRPIATSALFVPAPPVPAWFLWLIGGRAPIARLTVPATVENERTVVLQTDPINEAGEVWTQSRDAVAVLAGFAALSTLLISVVVGRALRSLEQLSAAFEHIGEGNHPGLLPTYGPPELRQLAVGFNLMTGRIAAAAALNNRLNERLLTLQAEERADLARDLHDEVGPLLFAVDMTTATIERLAADDRVGDIPAQAHAIHDAVGRMQRHIRLILARLRPLQAVGLEAAIDRLTAFWRSRRPEVVFSVTVSVEEDRIGNDVKETIYRVVQEGTSNAIRHGRPTQVKIAVTQDATDGVRIEVTDDGIGLGSDGSGRHGSTRLGLIGMRERVMAMAGSLAITPASGGRGLSLIACLPCESSSQSQPAGVPG